jgi:hypothetical protein
MPCWASGATAVSGIDTCGSQPVQKSQKKNIGIILSGRMENYSMFKVTLWYII